MPQVTIRTGFVGPDGREEVLSEFLCDAPGCGNVATDVVGCATECHAVVVMCAEHAPAKAPKTANVRPRRATG
jgi:hypothetical protein